MGTRFVGIPEVIWDGLSKGKIKGNALSVFTAIASFAPTSFPSVRRIAEFSNLNRKTVFKYLRILESMRIIKRIRRNGTSNLYEINPALLPSKTAEKMRAGIKKLMTQWSEKKLGRVSTKPNPFLGSLSTTMHISTVVCTTMGNLTPQLTQ